MDQWYWISEYLRLMLAYGFVLYVWPTVVFEKHLRGRCLAYRFGFCVTVPVIVINTLVLLLGLLHLLHGWIAGGLFLAVFFWRLFVNHPPFRALAADVRALSRETMSLRRLRLRSRDRLRAGLAAWIAPVRRRLRGRRLEFCLLLLLLIFGTIYFSYGAFDEHSYGFGDQYVHHQWTYGLTQGQIFYSGIYPEAMHCMIYLTCTIFRIPLYSGVLFFAGLHIHILLISAWVFMREVFHWRYTPLIVLAMYLSFNQLCVDEIFGMSRLSWTLPMEYALFTSFLCGAFLLRFLKRVLRGERVALHPLKPRNWGVLHDEDLFLFSAALAVSLAVHFYATIIAFFFCAVIALVYIRQVFRKGSFLPLAAAVLLGFFVAVAPMGAAYAAGYPLQGSLYWAMDVIQKGERNAGDQPIQGELTDTAPGTGGQTETASPEGTTPETEGGSPDTPDSRPAIDPLTLLKDKAQTLIGAGYNTLYPGPRSTAILAATAFALVTALPAHFLLALRDWRKRRRTPQGETPPPPIRDALDGVLITALLSVVLMVIYAARALHLPELVAGSRLCSTEQMLLLMLYAVPLDYLMGLAALGLRRSILGENLMKVLAVAGVFGVYALTQTGGFFHSYPYFELTRYNAAVEMTNRIIDVMPRQMYTVISTTEELYQVIETGYHEELLTFTRNQTDQTYTIPIDDTYTIPTPYLLLYIEKHPIQYAQYHFASGPRWLAWEDYPAFYPKNGSQCPEILHGEISSEAAAGNILYGSKLSDSAANLEGRIVLESKAYEWYQTFSAMHPRSCRVVYEDDDFMCCCITQNPGSLYTLGIMERNGEH